jgi:hypothetical protein
MLTGQRTAFKSGFELALLPVYDGITDPFNCVIFKRCRDAQIAIGAPPSPSDVTYALEVTAARCGSLLEVFR